MIVGTAHLKSILSSELQTIYHILPIDCSGDRDFSDMLQISQEYFIEINKSLQNFTLDNLVEMVESSINK